MALMRMKVFSGYQKLDGQLATLGAWTQSVLLLVIRLYWGWSFFLTGRGKLVNLGKTTEFFASLDLPLPKINAMVAGSTECVGGLLLLLGLGARLVSVPLMFTMIVAYATADKEALAALFSDPDKFVSAAPFQFLLASAIVFAFGPGKLALDTLWARKSAK